MVTIIKKYRKLLFSLLSVLVLAYVFFFISQNKVVLTIYIEPSNIPKQNISVITFCESYNQNALHSTEIDGDLILQLMELSPDDVKLQWKLEKKYYCTAMTRALIDMNKISKEELMDMLVEKIINIKVDNTEEAIVITKDMIHFID